jgi:hypothetical protein
MTFSLARSLGLALALAAASVPLLAVSDAEACGACFAPVGASSQVTSHRMAFALSTARTVLWDQVQYTGNPSEFGWVLPIAAKVDVGVSTEDFFNGLENQTRPLFTAPTPPACPAPTQVCRTDCGYETPAYGPGGAAASGDAGLAVDVWSDTVVGPYEAVQLSASDPSALRTWLSSHGYVLPTDMNPIIDGYVSAGFGFLAIKLVPGAGVDRMVPIRVAYDGGNTILPLRMVAGGTGDTVGITLFLLGDGRWETQTIPSIDIPMSQVTWDWSLMGGQADYFNVEQAAITAHKGNVFVTETTDRYAKGSFASTPSAGPLADSAIAATASDMDELNLAFKSADVQVTRLYAALPRTSLAQDLVVQASTGGVIPQTRVPTNQKNYACPTTVQVDCPGISPTCDGSGMGGVGGTGSVSSVPGGSSGARGCTAHDGSTNSPAWLLGTLGVLLGVGLVRRARGK